MQDMFSEFTYNHRTNNDVLNVLCSMLFISGCRTLRDSFIVTTHSLKNLLN